MRTDTAQPPRPKHLGDYQPPAFLVEKASLTFALDPEATLVTAKLALRRNDAAPADAPLWLDGEALELLDIAIDGQPLGAEDYAVTADGLSVKTVPDRFELTTWVRIAPAANTALSGLYLSSGMFCTQCEAEGFRRITYYPDRPDVLAPFDVRIEAQDSVPVLLSNGNPVGSGKLHNGRHFAEWSDPHPKPSYLFALVGGELSHVEDRFTTASGREVTLRVFVQEKDLGRCDYALDALKRAMRWDEEVFGREYDLDLFMIVAVDHFNFGAMENKGLNIFNASCVLASPETATDADYEMIESIVAHEYFHNWSGNRVTCRDWFQLCLKEGFTVFRDQEFSADQRSRAVQRIKDVRRLWARQFPEDAGPLAHPVRPTSYVAIDNFYTATVYDKGAELVRMMKALIGPEAFRRATDAYFERNDGTAATVEDFLSAMEEASGRDLSQFGLWYEAAGTPQLAIEEETRQTPDGYEHRLTLRQSTNAAGEAVSDAPRHIPFRFALIGENGSLTGEQLVELTGEEQEVVTEGLAGRPVLSALRGFSAPVRIDRRLSLEDRLLLLRQETDSFARWSESRQLALDIASALAGLGDLAEPDGTAARYAGALGEIASDETLDPAFRAEMLRLPSVTDLARVAPVIDPDALTRGHDALKRQVAAANANDLRALYDGLKQDEPYAPDAEQAGRRALRNEALRLLLATGEERAAQLAMAQAEAATNMTDEAAATAALALADTPLRQAALDRFYDRWQSDALVLNKWLAWQAAYPGGTALDDIRALTEHSAFDIGNPNKVRALIGVFATENLRTLHRPDGEGYVFFFDFVRRVDGLNPQVASRLLTAAESWQRLEPARRAMFENHLGALLEGDLSDNLFETATRLSAKPSSKP